MIFAITQSNNFEQIGFGTSVRFVFGGSLAIMTGGQIILTSFVLSILGLRTKYSTSSHHPDWIEPALDKAGESKD